MFMMISVQCHNKSLFILQNAKFNKFSRFQQNKLWINHLESMKKNRIVFKKLFSLNPKKKQNNKNFMR